MPERRRWSRGAKQTDDTVYVGRPSKWGNPFHVVDVLDAFDGDKYAAHADVVESYREYLTRDPAGMKLAESLSELRGKNLACWCAPGLPCHADVLLEMANEE